MAPAANAIAVALAARGGTAAAGGEGLVALDLADAAGGCQGGCSESLRLDIPARAAPGSCASFGRRHGGQVDERRGDEGE